MCPSDERMDWKNAQPVFTNTLTPSVPSVRVTFLEDFERSALFHFINFSETMRADLVSSSVVVMPRFDAALLIASLSAGVSRSSTASDLIRLRRSSVAEATGIFLGFLVRFFTPPSFRGGGGLPVLFLGSTCRPSSSARPPSPYCEPRPTASFRHHGDPRWSG